MVSLTNLIIAQRFQAAVELSFHETVESIEIRNSTARDGDCDQATVTMKLIHGTITIVGNFTRDDEHGLCVEGIVVYDGSKTFKKGCNYRWQHSSDLYRILQLLINP